LLVEIWVEAEGDLCFYNAYVPMKPCQPVIRALLDTGLALIFWEFYVIIKI
jgi:hypothetical protein